jgi:hypothetical protein
MLPWLISHVVSASQLTCAISAMSIILKKSHSPSYWRRSQSLIPTVARNGKSVLARAARVVDALSILLLDIVARPGRGLLKIEANLLFALHGRFCRLLPNRFPFRRQPFSFLRSGRSPKCLLPISPPPSKSAGTLRPRRTHDDDGGETGG